MTIRRETRQEDVLGPDNTSAQQWDSWFAAYGPRNDQGHPAALFDPVTGAIDHAIAERYRAFDLGSMIRSDPDRYLPVVRGNVRLVVGGADNFYLNEAVALLAEDVTRLSAAAPLKPNSPPPTGSITIVPGLDHSTIFQSAEVRAFPSEMLDYLRSHPAPK